MNKKFNDFLTKMNDYKLPLWEELPDLDLYMDQVITLMEKYISPITNSNSKSITPSMINNYVKLGIIPPPQKKKYSRNQLAYLIIICSLKQTMPISRIKEIIETKLQKNDIISVFNHYVNLYNNSFDITLETTKKFDNNIDNNKDLYINSALFSAILSSRYSQLSEQILKLQDEEQ